MRRNLFLLSIVFTAAEFGTLAVLLHVFLGVGSSELGAAAIALVPSLMVLAGPWTLFASRWTFGLREDAPPKRVREDIVQLPRRVLFLRSVSTAAVALGLAPVAAHRFHLDLPAAAIIGGSAVVIAYGFNVGRAWAYRGLLDGLAAKVYADDPLRYAARTARERMFVAANVLGVVGAIASVLFTYFVVGAPLAEYATLMAVLPGIILVLCLAFLWEVVRATRPVVDFVTHQVGATAERALTAAGNAPYRLALANLLGWSTAAGAMAYAHWRRGAMLSEAAQVMAGIVAVGCGVVMYQAAWHRHILAPLRHVAAATLLGEGGVLPRSRLSLQVKLTIVVLLLLGFGGTFAVTTTYAEHQKTLSLAAGQRAEEELGALLARVPPGRFAQVKDRPVAPSFGGTLFVLHGGGGLWSSAPLADPAALRDAVGAGDSGIGSVPALRGSMAWRTLPGRLRVGVIQPWHRADQGMAGGAPLVFVFVSLLVASIGAMWLFAQELTAPVRALARAAVRLGHGELDEPILSTAADEVGVLAFNLEISRQQLQRTLLDVRELNASLEERVIDRTAALQAANAELQVALEALGDAQEQVVAAEKLASLGRLSAGIAHEVNNPLNFVKNALPPLKQTLGQLASLVESVALDPEASDAELATRVRALIASGRRGEVKENLAETFEIMKTMEHGVSRMAQTLRALLDFSRQAPDEAPVRFELRPAVEGALALLRHDLRGRVEVVLELSEVPSVVAQPGSLGEVLVNLVKNGAEAIQGPGKIVITARQPAPSQVELVVADSGQGMSADAVRRAFEPFFTTKPVGKGTGLGLAMVHAFAHKHGGTVQIESTQGRGTTVILSLPQPLAAARGSAVEDRSLG